MRKSPRQSIKMLGITLRDTPVMYLKFHSNTTAEIVAKVEISSIKINHEPTAWEAVPTVTKQELLAYLNMGAAFGKLVRLTVIEQ